MRPYAAAPGRLRELTAALDAYRPARQRLLATLDLGVSNRDPLAEWSEHLVAALSGGALAPSRVQADYDLTTPEGERAQVRYLANPDTIWVNEHLVRSLPGVDFYALVLFEAFEVTGVLLFPSDLTLIGAALGKRHGEQGTTLQFTRRNWWTIRNDPERFRGLGMAIWLPPL